MKKTLCITAIAIAALAAGCAKEPNPDYSTPEKTLEAIGKIVWDKPYREYQDTLSGDLQKIINPQCYQALTATWSGEYEIIKREDISPTQVILNTKFYQDGHNKSMPKPSENYCIVKLRFVLRDGEWKLDAMESDQMQNTITG